MVGDAGSGMGGGADRSGRVETGETGGRTDDAWRRIETERPERDRASRAHDAAHEPSEVFEKSHLSLPERDRSPGRFAVEDFSPEQRAELEETYGRSLEDILASRDRAYAAEQQRAAEAGPPPELESYDELPSDDTANLIVRDYRDGHLSYDAATRRLDLLGHQPRPTESARDADQREQADGIEKEEPDSSPVLRAPSDQSDQTDTGDTGETGASTAGDTGGAGNDNGDGGADQPTPSHSDDEPGDEPTDTERAQLTRIATGLRDGDLTSEEAADLLDQLRNTDRDERSTASEDAREPETPSETDGTVPHDEPTTETVATKDGLTYERPERREAPNVFEAPPGDQRGFKELRRVAGSGGHDLLDGMKELGNNMDAALQEVVPPSPSPSWETPQYGHIEGGPGDAAGSVALLVFAIATGVHAAKERWDNRKSDAS